MKLDTTILQSKSGIELINFIEKLVEQMKKDKVKMPERLKRELQYIRKESAKALRLNEEKWHINAKFLKSAYKYDF
tara:strand:+ start:1528 stop:1755 length:228 start_codon:yes stop_codon:yes gene_type:complete